MSLEPNRDVAAVLGGLQDSIDGLRADMNAVLAQLQTKPAGPPVARQWYSVDEVAAMLGRSSFTVREWCRNGQVHAAKKAERRGGAALWAISAEEVARYRDEGLLPVNADRNSTN